MPRESRPWFNRQSRWWCTDIANRRHKLIVGKPDDDRCKRPSGRLGGTPGAADPVVLKFAGPAGPAIVPVPSNIDEYLEGDCRENSPGTFAEKKRVLQVFGRDRRNRPAADLKPNDLQKWIGSRRPWRRVVCRVKLCPVVLPAPGGAPYKERRLDTGELVPIDRFDRDKCLPEIE